MARRSSSNPWRTRYRGRLSSAPVVLALAVICAGLSTSAALASAPVLQAPTHREGPAAGAQANVRSKASKISKGGKLATTTTTTRPRPTSVPTTAHPRSTTTTRPPSTAPTTSAGTTTSTTAAPAPNNPLAPPVTSPGAAPGLVVSPPPLVGLMEPDGTHFTSERSLGVDLVTIPIGWDAAEPAPGVFQPQYAQAIIANIRAAQAAGLSVILDPGIQYAPSWVLGLDSSSQFVDQYGDRYGGPPGSGNAVANAVTDQSVQNALAAYLTWLGQQFPAGLLYAVRVGGGPAGELRYPQPDYNGHTNCYWAYDPASQQSSPVPGWVPGTGTPAQAQQFINTYNANLAGFGAWLSGQFSTSFPGLTQLLVLPGWGQRPGYTDQAVATLLAEGSPELNMGTDWAAQLAALPDPGSTVAYTTWVDADSQGSTPQLLDPADYLATLVQGTSVHLGGENTGGGSYANLTRSLSRAAALGFTVVNWMGEPQLYNPQLYAVQQPGSSTISPSTFAAAIKQYIG